jgi:hypothetical protein
MIEISFVKLQLCLSYTVDAGLSLGAYFVRVDSEISVKPQKATLIR